MKIKYGIDMDSKAIEYNLKRLTNQIYKLLPTREEESDWKKPLETILEELAGMSSLLSDQHAFLFPLLCKLEGLLNLTEETDFLLFRRVIFECLNLISGLKNVIRESE